MQPACASLKNLGGNHTGPNTSISTLAMHLLVEAISKPACFYIVALGVYLCSVPPQPIPTDELCKKFDNLSTAVNGKNHSAKHPTITCSLISPWFNYRMASKTFSLSYFPYIFSTWVVFMSTVDTLHTMGLRW